MAALCANIPYEDARPRYPATQTSIAHAMFLACPRPRDDAQVASHCIHLE